MQRSDKSAGNGTKETSALLSSKTNQYQQMTDFATVPGANNVNPNYSSNDKGKEPEENEELKLDDYLIKSDEKFIKSSADRLAIELANEFNKGLKRSLVTQATTATGTAVPRNHFWLVTQDNTNHAELIPPTSFPVRTVWAELNTVRVQLVKQSDLVIGAAGKYLINPRKGFWLKAFVNNQPRLIDDDAPKVITDPTFRFINNDHEANLISKGNRYTQHSTLHILSVPEAQLAKITENNTVQRFLEYRKQPYVFDDPGFSLTKNGDSLFYSASSKLLVHGPLKRVIPYQGEVAVSNNNGKLEIIHPSDKPFLITSPTHTVYTDFFQTSMRTTTLPQDGKKLLYNTRDNLPIGMQLAVIFNITDVDKAVLNFGSEKGLIDHIFKITNAAMATAISSHNSSDFLSASEMQSTNSSSSSAEKTVYEDCKRDVTSKMQEDFRQRGINLIQLNIESPTIENKEVAQQMASSSLLASTKRAEVAALIYEGKLTIQHAEQAAAKKSIEQKQANETTRLQTEAEISKTTAMANAEANNILTIARAKAEALKIEMEAKSDAKKYKQEIKGGLYQKYPELLQVKMTKTHAKALGQSSTIVSPELAQAWMMNGFFNSAYRQPTKKERAALESASAKQVEISKKM